VLARLRRAARFRCPRTLSLARGKAAGGSWASVLAVRAQGTTLCRAGCAGRGTALALRTERPTLASDPDPRQGLGSD